MWSEKIRRFSGATRAEMWAILRTLVSIRKGLRKRFLFAFFVACPPWSNGCRKADPFAVELSPFTPSYVPGVPGVPGAHGAHGVSLRSGLAVSQFITLYVTPNSPKRVRRFAREPEDAGVFVPEGSDDGSQAWNAWNRSRRDPSRRAGVIASDRRVAIRTTN
jgi:hypothetical protein